MWNSSNMKNLAKAQESKAKHSSWQIPKILRRTENCSRLKTSTESSATRFLSTEVFQTSDCLSNSTHPIQEVFLIDQHFRCSNLHYLRKLPKVSIIIAFHNDYPSVLKRTIHSIFNRSPPELIHEIILVNDASTKKELHKPLKKYVQQQFGGKLKIYELPKRSGLILARLEGTKHATGEVLVFLDPQIEVGVS